MLLEAQLYGRSTFLPKLASLHHHALETEVAQSGQVRYQAQVHQKPRSPSHSFVSLTQSPRSTTWRAEGFVDACTLGIASVRSLRNAFQSLGQRPLSPPPHPVRLTSTSPSIFRTIVVRRWPDDLTSM